MPIVRNLDGNRTPANGAGRDDAEQDSIGQLFRRMSVDSTHLVRQEINLAKVELGHTAHRLGKSATQLGIALAVAIPGLLALTAFLVIGLGDLLDNYWAGALIVAVALLGVGATLVKRALATIKEGIRIPETAATLRDDAAWAKQEAQTFKREFTA